MVWLRSDMPATVDSCVMAVVTSSTAVVLIHLRRRTSCRKSQWFGHDAEQGDMNQGLGRVGRTVFLDDLGCQANMSPHVNEYSQPWDTFLTRAHQHHAAPTRSMSKDRIIPRHLRQGVARQPTQRCRRGG